jgi:hypothetical protein
MINPTAIRGLTMALLAGSCLLADAGVGYGQYQRRYEPSRPTVSPYLNLFRFNNSIIPNYQSLVRPEQESLRFQQRQQLYNRQQSLDVNQLRSNLNTLQQPAVATELVAPTGHGAWFNRQGGASYLNTSRYYSQSGVSTPITAGR